MTYKKFSTNKFIQSPSSCDACQLGKNHKQSFKSNENTFIKPFEFLHTDLWGPTPLNLVNGFRYYFRIVDDHTRFIEFFP